MNDSDWRFVAYIVGVVAATAIFGYTLLNL